MSNVKATRKDVAAFLHMYGKWRNKKIERASVKIDLYVGIKGLFWENGNAL